MRCVFFNFCIVHQTYCFDLYHIRVNELIWMLIYHWCSIVLCTGMSSLSPTVPRLWRSLSRPVYRLCQFQAGGPMCGIVPKRLLCRWSKEAVRGVWSPVFRVPWSNSCTLHFLQILEAVSQPRWSRTWRSGMSLSIFCCFFTYYSPVL